MVELAMTSMEKLQGLFHLSFVDRIVEGERRLSFKCCVNARLVNLLIGPICHMSLSLHLYRPETTVV